MSEQGFEWSMEELCKLLNDTAETDKDNIVPVDGNTGSGKSTLALKLCMKGCSWFDMKRDILYSRKEIIEWITNAQPGSWGLADEAVNALFKRDFQRGDQKFILKLLDMCRDRNLTLFLCIPNFWALDKHILEGRIRLRIHVARTGLSFMWIPSTNPFAPDRWYRKYNEVVCRNWDSYPNARKTKGFVGVMSFGDLGADQKRTYLEIKAKKKAEVKAAEEAEEQEEEKLKARSMELGKTFILVWMFDKGWLRPGALTAYADFAGVTKEAVSQKIKQFRLKFGSPTAEKLMASPDSLLYNNNVTTDTLIDDNKEIAT
jgi:hypothetical protein